MKAFILIRHGTMEKSLNKNYKAWYVGTYKPHHVDNKILVVFSGTVTSLEQTPPTKQALTGRFLNTLWNV